MNISPTTTARHRFGLRRRELSAEEGPPSQFQALSPAAKKQNHPSVLSISDRLKFNFYVMLAWQILIFSYKLPKYS